MPAAARWSRASRSSNGQRSSPGYRSCWRVVGVRSQLRAAHRRETHSVTKPSPSTVFRFVIPDRGGEPVRRSHLRRRSEHHRAVSRATRRDGGDHQHRVRRRRIRWVQSARGGRVRCGQNQTVLDAAHFSAMRSTFSRCPRWRSAGNWPVAACLIAAERTGRAIRRPVVRACCLACKQVGGGRAFGINESLDAVGATIGPLVVACVIAWRGDYRLGFAVC